MMRIVATELLPWVVEMACDCKAEAVEARVLDADPVRRALLARGLVTLDDIQGDLVPCDLLTSPQGVADYPLPRPDDVWLDCSPRSGAARVLRVKEAGDCWLSASIIGQLMMLIIARLSTDSWWFDLDERWRATDGVVRIDIEHDLVLEAASQVSLVRAYRGELAGVDPQELLAWRLDQMATANKITPRRINSLFFEALALLGAETDAIEVGPVQVLDLLHRPAPLLDEAAVFSDQPALLVDPDCAALYHLVATPPDAVDIFERDIAPAEGLRMLMRDDHQGHSVWLFSGTRSVG